MKTRLALTVLFLALSQRAVAASDELSAPLERPPAQEYAHGSVSIIGSASLDIGLFGSSREGTAFQATALTGSIAVRFVTRVGFTLEPRVGLDALLATGNTGLYAILAGRTGLGVGWAFALGRVALTPMVSYEAMVVGGGITSNLSGLAHIGSVELPLTVFFSRNAFVEVFVRGGLMALGGEATPVFTAGYRFGMVW